jgi:hypothetical protein
LKEAFTNTSEKRASFALLADVGLILGEVEQSEALIALWKNYRSKYEYAADIPWNDVILAVRVLVEKIS